jgi:hypothetical protein
MSNFSKLFSIFLVLSVFLVSVKGYGLCLDYCYGSEKITKEEIKTISIGRIAELNILNDGGTLTVLEEKRNDIQINVIKEAMNEKDIEYLNVVYETSLDKVKIEGKISKETDNANIYITIHTPKLKKINVSQGAGSIKIQDITSEELNVSVSAGSILINNSATQRFDISTHAGSISLQNLIVKPNGKYLAQVKSAGSIKVALKPTSIGYHLLALVESTGSIGNSLKLDNVIEKQTKLEGYHNKDKTDLAYLEFSTKVGSIGISETGN